MNDFTPPYLADERPLQQSLLRGLRKRCPNCGDGRMFGGFLRVKDRCTVCNEELHYHSADDGPAYLVILIVGHLMAPLLLWSFVAYRPSPWVLITVFTIGCIALSLFLLPRMKGMIVAIQWSRRMHGFDRP